MLGVGGVGPSRSGSLQKRFKMGVLDVFRHFRGVGGGVLSALCGLEGCLLSGGVYTSRFRNECCLVPIDPYHGVFIPD